MKHAWPQSLSVEVKEGRGFPLVRLAGEVTPNTAPDLNRAVRRLMEEGRNRLIVDTRDLKFLGPAGYEALRTLAARLEQDGGAIAIVDDCLPVERELKLLHVEQIAEVVPSITQAAAYLEWHE